LRLPQDGLFTGCVAAVDTSNSTYRVTFDRQGLGTHSIPDYEVLSMDPPDLMPLSSFMSKARHRPMQNISTYLSPPPYGSAFSPQLTGDPLLSGSTPKGKSLRLDGTLGGYPVKFLFHIVRLNKSLQVKLMGFILSPPWLKYPGQSCHGLGRTAAIEYEGFNGDETA
jgi:hypothetical protein